MTSTHKKGTLEYAPLGILDTLGAWAFVLVGVWYLHWRASTLAANAPIFSAILYAAEIFGFATALLHLMMTWRLTVRRAPAPEAGLSVDVFIPTYNESVDLVRKTVLAARQMDYPHATWLLDDGNRPQMRQLAERLGIGYLARSENTHAKAGNLNHALAHSRGALVVIFDADHAPQKNFLTETLGYFRDPQVAFVQTPQDFFNLDSYQHRWQKKKKQLWTEQSLFFKVIQRGKDYWNSAFFCGSCAVVRRSALERVGGFATDTITEDLHTSIKLHKAGYRSIYHHESLAFGIAPASVAPFLKQRVRWGQGAMQVLRHENIFFTRKLTLAQKLNYLASMATYFDGWQKGVFYVSPAIVLTTGIMPIEAGGIDFLLHFLPYYVLSLLIFEEVGRGYGGILFIEQYNFARFAAFAWSTLGLFMGKLRFRVTDKSRGGASSRFVFLPQIAMLLLNAGAIPIALIFLFEWHHLPPEAFVFNAVWATLNTLLGLALFRFTRRTEAFLRAEYRFPVPLPVRVADADGEIFGTIDNVSATGCRIYARLPATARRGAHIRGEIALPSGSLPFEAEIVSEIEGKMGTDTFTKAVGCRFVWNLTEHQDALELFLYGNDLQWRLLEIHENRPTPLEWVRRQRTGTPTLPVARDERWASCTIDTPEHGAMTRFGLVQIPNDGGVPHLTVSFAPLAEGARLTASIFTRTGLLDMAARVADGTAIPNSSGPVYLYHLADCTISPAAHPADGQKDAPCPSTESLSEAA